MRRMLYIIGICIVVLTTLSCERRQLTYDYSPYCDVVVNVDWSDLSETPTGMSVRAYPQDGGTPIIVQSNTISSASLSLSAGVYNILVFNQIPSDYGTVSFRGMDKWETAEVYANNLTTTSWATSKSDIQIVREPEDIAVATYLGVEVCEDCVAKSTELFKLTGERIVAETISVQPKVIVKRTFVRVKVDGIKNLLSTRAVLTGMAEGYNFSTQQSCDEPVSHVLDSWQIEDYAYGDQYGETNSYFMSFGLPTGTTATRSTDDWVGSIELQMLLVDNKTIIEHNATISNYTTSDEDETKNGDEIDTEVSTEVSTEINITVEVGFSIDPDDAMPSLPDVAPEGSTSGGFEATVDGWGDEVEVELPL